MNKLNTKYITQVFYTCTNEDHLMSCLQWARRLTRTIELTKQDEYYYYFDTVYRDMMYFLKRNRETSNV